MPMFNSPSLCNLMKCHADLQLLFFEVVRTRDCIVLGLFDDIAPSMAVNVVPCDSEHNLVLCEKQQYFFAGFVAGVASRLHAEGKMLYRLHGYENCYELKG